MRFLGLCALILALIPASAVSEPWPRLTDAQWRSATPADVVGRLPEGAVHARGPAGATALMWAAWLSDDPRLIDALVDSGAEIDARDVYGATALMWAAAGNRSARVVETLLRRGASLDTRSSDGWNALMYSSRYNDEIDVVAALLPVNARIDLSVDGDRSVLAAVWEENAVAETASESRLVPMVLPDVPPELLDGLQREYQEWLNLEPGRQEAQYGRLRDDALSIAARYPGTYPAIQSILINADALARLERWTDAQSVYEQAAEIAAGSDLEWTALYGAAVSAESAGEIAAARSFYEVLVRRDALQNPLAARAYFSIGRISESLGDIDRALSAYQTVRELFPDDSWSSFAMTRIIAIRVANQDR